LIELSKPSGGRLTKKGDRVVLDTGVLISSFVFGGMPERAVKKAVAEYQVCVCSELLKEYRDVPLALEAQGKIDHSQLKALLAGIASVVSTSRVAKIKRRLEICRDPKDNMLVECCLAARARALITGDKDLLSVKDLPFRLDIVSPRSFVDSF